MAALAIVGAMMSSCSEAIEVAQPANTGKTVMVKTTVSLDENATTRALTSNGEKTFAAGEQIAVIYENTSNQTVKAVSLALTDDDIDNNTYAHNATFSVPLTNPKPGGDVRYVYPASRAAATIATDAAVDGNATINYAALATQDGTFASLANDLDLATTFNCKLTESGTLPATVTLANPLTIGKFTIMDSSSGYDYDITEYMRGLNISDGTNTYAVTTTTSLSTFYVAMQPISSTQTVVVNATDGTFHYTKSVTGKTLAASKIYDIAVTINYNTPGANLSAVTADYIAQDGEELTGTLGSNVKLSIANGAEVTLNNVTINGVSDDNYNWAGITCEGNATIILADGSTNSVKGFYRGYSGIYVASGKTLTIKGGTSGTGTLNASSNGAGAGIGCSIGTGLDCGNIEIQGGVITATGGIGSCSSNSCGTITISGGNVTATGNMGAAIGNGGSGSCGNITISGGIVDATSMQCAGIGGGNEGTCGNITISGGTIEAKSMFSAGIGGGYEGTCGNITISGGSIKATGGVYCAGIGGGNGDSSDSNKGKCGTITITNGVTKVEATKGLNAPNFIGKGLYSDCGTVTVDNESSWSGTSTTNLTCTTSGNTLTLSYNAHSVTNGVPGDLGKLIGADGKIYANAAQASAASTTAVAMIAYVGSETGSTTYNHGLAIALTDATIKGGTNSKCKWSNNTSSIAISASASSTMTDHKGFLNGIDATDAFTSTTPPLGADYTAAKIAKNYGITAPTGTSGWFLPSNGQWLKFFEAAGVDVANWTSWDYAPAPGDGGTQADNWTKINALLSAVGGAVEQGYYWSSSEQNQIGAVPVFFSLGYGVALGRVSKDGAVGYVRSFLAF